jgi:hypothetical protein
MKIKIGNYRIQRADDLNIIVEEYRKPKHCNNPEIEVGTEEKWVFQGYYSRLENALNRIVDLSLSNQEIDSANNLIEKIIELRGYIHDAVPPRK